MRSWKFLSNIFLSELLYCKKRILAAGVGNYVLLSGSRVSSPCNYTEQCQYHDPQAVCVELQDGQQASQCLCRAGWQLQRKNKGHQACHLLQPQPSSDQQAATLAGLGLGLSGLTCLICFTFRLFSKARTVETR